MTWAEFSISLPCLPAFGRGFLPFPNPLCCPVNIFVLAQARCPYTSDPYQISCREHLQCRYCLEGPRATASFSKDNSNVTHANALFPAYMLADSSNGSRRERGQGPYAGHTAGHLPLFRNSAAARWEPSWRKWLKPGFPSTGGECVSTFCHSSSSGSASFD